MKKRNILILFLILASVMMVTNSVYAAVYLPEDLGGGGGTTVPTTPDTPSHTHSYKQTDKTGGTCSTRAVATMTCACGASYTKLVDYNAGNHEGPFSNSYPVVSPDCITPGTKETYCEASNCLRLVDSETYYNTSVHAGPYYRDIYDSYSEPTCTEPGRAKFYCGACDAYIGLQDWEDPLGHSWGTWSRYTNPTCTTEGQNRATCTRCGTVGTSPVAKLGHNMGTEYVVTDPTCTTDGLIRKNCQRDGCNYKEDTVSPKLGHSMQAAYVLVAAKCTTTGTNRSECGRNYCSYYEDTTTAALGHSWSAWKYDTVNHWKVCTRSGCTAQDSFGAHVDVEPNGYCDTCNAPLYLPPTPAPTITVKDTAGNVVNTTWTNKDLVVYLSGSEIVRGTLGAVGYKYNKNNAAYAVYPSSGVSHTTLNTDTTFYAKGYNTGMESQETSVVSKVLPKIEKTKPTFTLTVDNNNWAKSHTATITFADAGGSGLKEDTYTITYLWTDSASAPSSYGSTTKSIAVTAGSTSKTETITKSDGTGLYYLHIKINKKLTDIATNACDTTTLSIPFYMDNTAPVITQKSIESNPVALNSSATYTMGLLVTDLHAGITTGNFTASDITVKVNGSTSTATKELTYKSVSNGVYEYSLRLANITETGPITLTIAASAIPDNATNNSAATTFELTKKSGMNFVGPYADNIDPYIHMMGPVTSVTVDAGKNLSGVIDERYINKYYTIQIPFKILDVGGQDFTNVFESTDVAVAAGTTALTPSRLNVVLDATSTKADSPTNLTLYEKDYTLTLYGLLENGYINLTVAASSLTDLAGNVNTQTKFSPYTDQTGSNVVIYIDNTAPQPTVKTALAAAVVNGATTVNVDMFLKELGAGIRADQFTEDDMKYRIEGVLINTITASLQPDANNNYESELGSTVPTNYTYKLILSNIKENGTLRIQITDNKIIDKANNGNTSVTLDINIEIDNAGPKLGILTTNADANGFVYGETIQVSIIGCSDPSGIAKYEWQRSVDGENFETIFVDNSAATNSTVEDVQNIERKYYYRVIVTDTLGNSSTSEVVWVEYRHALNTKPIITLTRNQKSSELIEIHGVIKSKSPIVKIVINGNEFPKSQWQNNVVTNNYEITTTFDYPVTKNGIYTVEVTDEKGNTATATINIIDFDFTEPVIDYTKKDATPLTPAQIIFTANEPVRIINPNAHPGITYDTTDFSTKIIATVSPDVDFDESKIFDFENKGLTEVPVEVLPPLITRFAYLRFAGPTSTNLNMTVLQINSLVENVSSTQVITPSGKIKSYYGLKNANTQISTQADINTADKLGSAVEAYVIGSNGELVKLEKTIESTVSSNSNYSTGNVSGAYKKTSGLLDNYSDSLLNDTTIKYARFRMTMVP